MEISITCLIYAEICWAIGWGGILASYGWRQAGKCAQRVSTSIWAFPKLYQLLGKGCWKGLQYSLWAFPKESPIPFRYFSNGLHELLDTFPSESPHNLSISFTFPSKQCVSVYKDQKSKAQQKNVRTISGSSTDYFLSNHTTFSQTHTDATAPLRSAK